MIYFVYRDCDECASEGAAGGGKIVRVVRGGFGRVCGTGTRKSGQGTQLRRSRCVYFWMDDTAD
jgi:hypothetical protein